MIKRKKVTLRPICLAIKLMAFGKGAFVQPGKGSTP
jgi:hypothetical protein